MAHDHGSDVFISHAGEDKAAVARPLSAALSGLGWDVWMDEERLDVGDSLEGSINKALAHAQFGAVVLSKSFFSKPWPKRELEGLATRETIEDRTVILPVWHKITGAEIAAHSPILAGKVAANTSDGIDVVAQRLDRALRRAIGGPKRSRPVLQSLSYDVVILSTERAPDWGAAEGRLSDLDGKELAERASEAWATLDVWGEFPMGRGDYIRMPDAEKILLDDLRDLSEAVDSPPEWLATAILDDGRAIHVFDEREMPNDFQQTLNRLRDAGMLQAAGLTPGGW